MNWSVVKESEGVRRLWTERQWCTMYRKARSQVRSHLCSEFGLIEDLFEGNESLVASQVTSLAEGLLKFPSGERQFAADKKVEAVFPKTASVTFVSLAWDLALLEVRICARGPGSDLGQDGNLIPGEMFI